MLFVICLQSPVVPVIGVDIREMRVSDVHAA